ncbi:MAG: magnesium transporter MgtC [Candidatus Ryanbacteria bacterium CG10_big_fil_rev_8_21_14_0_10_43_42]|uniref:Magnesium transporter MgtC n=1 Tax=Candidatus Ryanbacteria bacterium CG10_big_fil_rev_8_21_14_0_10_43_42 TaxID=1974864 RepID=A0A2M8KY72_9BACT|nr:MAG: magnesium transporter MgtC [Candidatus Ryanbacteria bacterium CG10_big_fil_rev_8_21_14_0_10_43_42]
MTGHIFLQLILAVFLGMMIGVEREHRRKAAGMRTYALVSMGAALFTIMSVAEFSPLASFGTPDPTRIISQVVVGIGFIGGGLIVLQGDKVMGLTTAAALWVAAAIGIAVGLQMYMVSVFATILTLLVVWAFRFVEEKVPRVDRSVGRSKK